MELHHRGAYQIYFVHNTAYEVLVVDNNKDAAIFHYPGPGHGCLFMRQTDPQFVTVCTGIMEGLMHEDMKLDPERFNGVFETAAVTRWVQSLRQ